MRALIAGLFLLSALAVEGQSVRPWWVAGDMGAGQFKLSSDQSKGKSGAIFAAGFAGGHRLGSRARVGLLLNGWLLQAFNLNDPTVGESVSTVSGVVDAFPVPKVPLFLRGGIGAAFYTNNRPLGTGGSGLAWTVGGGYEIPLTRNLALSPFVGYSAGGLGDVRNPLTVETHRRYSVVEFKAGVVYHFGTLK